MIRTVDIKSDGKDFKVTCDANSIRNAIADMRTKYDEFYYVPYGESHDGENPYINKEDYLKNIDTFEKAFESMIETEHLQQYVDDAKKKKNGMLYKGRIVKRLDCANTHYVTDWHCTWIYEVIKIKAISEDTLKFVCETYTDTPG